MKSYPPQLLLGFPTLLVQNYNVTEMKYFWIHKDEISEDLKGYGQFSKTHVLLLIMSVILVAVYAFLYRSLDPHAKLIMLRITGLILIGIDVVKLILIGFSNAKLSENLPLEICSFAAYFIVCDSFWVGNSIFPGMLLTLFLPAAIMAVLFPTTSALPALNFYTIHQFLYHDLIIAYILTRFVNREIPLLYHGVWRFIGIILILVAVIYLIDTIFHRNFMFLKDTYGNPLLEVIWKITGGGIAYTGGLILFCIFMIHVFYAFFKIISLIFCF